MCIRDSYIATVVYQSDKSLRETYAQSGIVTTKGKWHIAPDGAHYFLCRGKEKVSAEIALSFLAYNLRRAINLLGAGALVAHFNERNRKNRG